MGNILPPRWRRGSLPRARASRLDATAAVAALRRYGCLRVDGVLPAELCNRLLAHSEGAMEAALASAKSGEVRATDAFAEHLLAGDQVGKRLDHKLRLDEPVVRAALLQSLQALCGVYDALLGADAELFELSTIISELGTPQQGLHPDFPPYGDVSPVALVVFLALSDLSIRQGPTSFLPSTHTISFHATPQEERDDADLARLPRCTPLLRRGDAVIMDSALYHAGGANRHARRTLFHFTLKRRDAYPGGRFSSLLEELRGRHTLAGLLAAGAGDDVPDGGRTSRM